MNIPTQDGFGIHLVYVLTPRSAASCKRELQFMRRQDEPAGHHEILCHRIDPPNREEELPVSHHWLDTGTQSYPERASADKKSDIVTCDCCRISW